jgi:hypothetical protein
MKYVPTFWLESGYALSLGVPMDSRTVVGSVANLTTTDIWMKDGVCIAYNGMLVGVADNKNIGDSGLYYLFDPECKTSLQSPNVQNIDNWIKLCSVAQLNALSSRILQIEKDLSGITADIKTLQNDVSSIKTEINNMDERIDKLEVFPDMICGGNSEA